MKPKYYLLATIIVFVLHSCTSIQNTTSIVNVDNKVYQTTIADLDVLDKAEKTITWGWHPFIKFGQSLNARKENITAELIKDKKADILLEPQFIYESSWLGRRVLTVSGYPAVFKSFRSATVEELKILNNICGDSSRDLKIKRMKR